MEIKTKFNVGDIIWTIRQVNKEIKCPKCRGNAKVLVGNIEYYCEECYGTGKVLSNELEWIVQKENPCKITRIRILVEKNRTEITYLGGEDIFKADCLAEEQNCFINKEQAQAECDKRNNKTLTKAVETFFAY